MDVTSNAPYKTIDECYNLVISKLTALGKVKEVSTDLMTKDSNDSRVLYIYNLLEELGYLPILKSNPKDNKVAKHYRCLGNQCFAQKKNCEAWQYYNLSLLYCCDVSEDFIYAVSNRSAVFHEMKKYEECLEDIKFVFNTEFPEALKDKLLKRKQLCEAELAEEIATDKNEAIIADILTMKSPKDEKYLSSSSKLKVVYSREMGRHVIANEDIEVGEVLVQEEPYLTVLLKSQFLFTCAHCLSRKLNLYPCMGCTYALYCSEECREEAYKKYHALECPVMASMVSYNFTKMDWLALRTSLKSRCEYDDWFDVFEVSIDADANVNTRNWGCVKVADKWVYESKNYTSIHTLATNVDIRSISDIFRKSLTAAVLLHLLALSKYIRCEGQELLTDHCIKYVADNLLRHIMTSPTNMHGISSNIENSEGKFLDECNIASGAYAFLSLLNHSCSPNVVRYSKLGTGQMTLLAIRPIKKGMQIFDNYGYHHALQNRDTRRANLKFQYKFDCNCKACVDDWPTHEKATSAKDLPADILQKTEVCLDKEVIAKLMTGDKETAVKYFKPLCELIGVLDAFAPCRELAECQEAMKQCLAIFHGTIPYSCSEILDWEAIPQC
ncbi:SET and MYND domain containing, class 4, member 4 [Anticarsia gemmatalis]|uniref:SET and MYND domain containing, class 4, member 4 n=1 Tax=Anticarsia gemmatalis TaxID=129554 RepID=UPI003F76178B